MTGQELYAIRSSLELSQVDFADLLGVHRVTIAKYETNARPIPKVVANLAKTLTQRGFHNETLTCSDVDN
jgi:DNA-binding transcriptional regulator YiaG